MEKNVKTLDILKRMSWLRVLIMMKLTIFLICFSVLSSIASGTYSQNNKISLNLKRTTIQYALKEIENNSNYFFLYNNDLINVDKVVDLKVENQGIESVLDQLFQGEDIKYVVMDRQIIITPGNSKAKSFSAQSKITGKVTNASGESIPGVTVLIKGTTIGTITDVDGRYSLPAQATDVLVFSFVGMKKEEIQVKGSQSINVVLREDEMALDEVIVIGYGTAKRSDYTGSVSSVKMENSPMALAPNFNALESLKGNVSGLNIGATNEAGGEPSMIIRGQNSINGSNDPLIILDGVIYLGSLSDINPNDIASYDILKDAVSAAAYGSRSANGIIAITTHYYRK